MGNRLNIAIDPKLKNSTSKLYKNLGMSLSTAIKVFLKQSLADNGMPFRPNLNPVPNEETKEAMREARHPESYKSYRSTKDMMKDILNDDN